MLEVHRRSIIVPPAQAVAGDAYLPPIAGGAVSSNLFGQALLLALTKKIDLSADDIRCALFKSTYTPDQDAHVYYADTTPGTNEVSGAGYTAGGLALSSKAVTYTAGGNVVTFTAANLSWTGATITARRAVYYDRSPATDATRPLIGWVDFGADVVVVGGTLLLDVSAGIVTVTSA